MSGMFPVVSFPCMHYRTEDYYCVSVSHLFGSPLSLRISVYEWPHLSVALTGSLFRLWESEVWVSNYLTKGMSELHSQAGEAR